MIRPANADDYTALQDIERRAGGLFREIGMAHIADDEPHGEEELATAETVLVAIDQVGDPVGYAMVSIVDGHAHLEQISVLPEHGGRGIGTALLDAVAEWAAARGDAEVTLTTFRDVPFNAPLYAKRGFSVVIERDWTDGLRALVAREAALGLDPTTRVVMRRSAQ